MNPEMRNGKRNSAVGQEELDLFAAPLEGVNLIEASAGTGKTFAIAALYLRLILERELSVDRILVVTFTKAATDELRSRIRKRLVGALKVMEGGSSDDPFVVRYLQGGSVTSLSIRLLRNAIVNFDEAAIFTIHGFCRRVLQENAFESGSPFDTELVSDQNDLAREAAEDFWRSHMYSAPYDFVHFVTNCRNTGVETFVGLANDYGSKWDLKVLPDPIAGVERVEPSLFQPVRLAAAQLGDLWRGRRSEIAEAVKSPAMNGNLYRKSSIPFWIKEMDAYFDRDPFVPFPLPKSLTKWTAESIAGGTKKNQKPPEHPFFHACGDYLREASALETVLDEVLLGLKVKFLRGLKEELDFRKERRNLQHFDDLLLKVRKSLAQGGGSPLGKAVRGKFAAALVDEFQDTDPVQYAIFRTVFAKGRKPLFLIGDPKQAIYSFRGADLYSYLKASGQVDRRFTLPVNRRSVPGLIEAVNTLFSAVPNPFLYQEIAFHPTRPPEAGLPRLLTESGETGKPLQLWIVDSESDKAESGLTEKESDVLSAVVGDDVDIRICDAVAVEIHRLLTGARESRILLGGEPLKESDIAVLVRTHIQARKVQKALNGVGINSVLYKQGNVFASRESEELCRVMEAVLEPAASRVLKAALITRLLGLNGEDLGAFHEEDADWSGWVSRFSEYRELWVRFGFARMFRTLLLREGIRECLVARTGGERALTNLLHLAELLQEQETGSSLPPRGLLKWFYEKRHEDTALEEHELRLESDERAVNVVTIHRSKGLEFPVVFCPFTWDASVESRNRRIIFHDAQDHDRLTADLGSRERNRHLAQSLKENLAEDARLLYVALTRAVARCYLIQPKGVRLRISAQALLSAGPDPLDPEDPVADLSARTTQLGSEGLAANLENLARRAPLSMEVTHPRREVTGKMPPVTDGRPVLVCREFTGSIVRDRRLLSFTFLATRAEAEPDLPEHDALPAPEEREEIEESGEDPDERSIFRFPKGAVTGNCFHEILERLDYTDADSPSVKELIAETLDSYGFDDFWLDSVFRMVRNVIEVPLVRGRSDFSLSLIDRRHRVNEMEFTFPLDGFSSKGLKEVLRSVSRDTEHALGVVDVLERLEFSSCSGFMRGFVDLVFELDGRFFLVDWKTNHLGNRIGEYGTQALESAMIRELYVLQYLIYTVAVDRYLARRLPGYRYEEHFGGVFYLFLRGIDARVGPDFGVYADRPSARLVAGLSEAFGGYG